MQNKTDVVSDGEDDEDVTMKARHNSVEVISGRNEIGLQRSTLGEIFDICHVIISSVLSDVAYQEFNSYHNHYKDASLSTSS